jgi:hypothetical protein
MFHCLTSSPNFLLTWNIKKPRGKVVSSEVGVEELKESGSAMLLSSQSPLRHVNTGGAEVGIKESGIISIFHQSGKGQKRKGQKRKGAATERGKKDIVIINFVRNQKGA